MIDRYTKMIDEIADAITQRDDVQYMAQDRALSRFDIDIRDDDAMDALLGTAAYQNAFDDELSKIFRDILKKGC